MRLRHEIYYYLARLHLMLKRYNASAEASRMALAANPGFARAAASLGLLHASREHAAPKERPTGVP